MYTLFLCVHAESPGITSKTTLALFNGKDFDGWYPYLREDKYNDPKHVFSIKDGMIRISGEEWGGIATRKTYRDYDLIVVWKWGGALRTDRTERNGIS